MIRLDNIKIFEDISFIKENIVSRAKKFDDKDSLQFCLDFCERGQRRLKKDSLQHKGYLK